MKLTYWVQLGMNMQMAQIINFWVDPCDKYWNNKHPPEMTYLSALGAYWNEYSTPWYLMVCSLQTSDWSNHKRKPTDIVTRNRCRRPSLNLSVYVYSISHMQYMHLMKLHNILRFWYARVIIIKEVHLTQSECLTYHLMSPNQAYQQHVFTNTNIVCRECSCLHSFYLKFPFFKKYHTFSSGNWVYILFITGVHR